MANIIYDYSSYRDKIFWSAEERAHWAFIPALLFR